MKHSISPNPDVVFDFCDNWLKWWDITTNNLLDEVSDEVANAFFNWAPIE